MGFVFLVTIILIILLIIHIFVNNNVDKRMKKLLDEINKDDTKSKE